VENGLDRIQVLKKTRSEGLNGLRSRTEASLAMTGKLSGGYPGGSRPFKWGGLEKAIEGHGAKRIIGEMEPY
jgi:hypothetical protein